MNMDRRERERGREGEREGGREKERECSSQMRMSGSRQAIEK